MDDAVEHDDLITRFATSLRDDHDRSEITVRNYTTDLRAFLAWTKETSGSARLDDVTPTTLKDYRARLTQHKHQASTINRKLAALRTFFKWAVSQELVSRNPMNGIKTIRQQASAPRWLDPRAEPRLQQAIEKRTQDKSPRALRDAAMLALLWKAGLRVSEVAALDLADVKIQSGRRGIVQVRQGKDRKSRNVPLNADAIQAIQAWQKARGKTSGPCSPASPTGASPRAPSSSSSSRSGTKRPPWCARAPAPTETSPIRSTR